MKDMICKVKYCEKCKKNLFIFIKKCMKLISDNRSIARKRQELNVMALFALRNKNNSVLILSCKLRTHSISFNIKKLEK